MPRHPNITLTLEMDDSGRSEKRARTDADKGKDGSEGLRTGEEMDVVSSEVGEDVKLSSPTSAGVGGNKVGSRSRSDSAPMWGTEQGGLSANWTGRGRSGSSFGQ